MKTRIAITLALLMLTPVALGAGKPKEQTSRAFTSFWAEFKAAVAKNDREAVASMTKLPFYFDNKELSRAEFIKSYNRIFDQKARRCFAREKPEKDGTGYEVFCGPEIFSFGLVEGKYRFIEIGAND
jgi:hypothetical protein